MENPGAPDIQALFPFSGLSEGARRYLTTRFRKFHFNAGEPIIQREKRGQFMAVVDQGLVDVEDERGGIRTLMPGQRFGEEMLHIGAASLVTATARADTSLWVLTRKDWLVAAEIQDPPQRVEPARRRRPVWPLAFAVVAMMVIALVFLYPELPNSVHHLLTGAMLNAGRPDLAEKYLRAAARLQPGSGLVYDELGYILYLQGKRSEALDAFEKAVALDDEFASAQNNLGVLLTGTSEPEQAIEPLKRAIELDPGNGEIYFNLGNAYLASGDRASAASAYRRAYELDPSQVEAMIQSAGLALEDGNLAQAEELWGEVLSMQPDQALAQRGLGVAAVLDGRPEEALAFLQAAITANPQDASAHFYLGLAFDRLGQPDEAAKEYATVQMLASDPVLSEQSQIYLEQIRQ